MRCLWKTDITRRGILTGLVVALGLTALSQRVVADDRKSVFMVLWRGETVVEDGFRAYVAEKNLPIDLTIRSLDRDVANAPAIVEEIKAAQPDLVYTWGTSTTLSIAGRDPALADGPDDFPPQITDIPIVFTMVSQPVRSRVVPSLGPSGRNITGVSHVVPLATQVQAMQAYMPTDRIAVIYTPTESNSVLFVEQLQELGQTQGLKIDAMPVPLDAQGKPDPATIETLVDQAAARGPQFLYLGADSFIGQYAKEFTDAANARGLATFASTERMLASSDALYGLVAPYLSVGRFTAQKVEAVLFGNQAPAAVPVETLPQFSYQVRIDVARNLEIFPSIALMDYAEIIGE